MAIGARYFIGSGDTPLSGLAGAFGVPYTRNRQYAGATAGDGPAELPSPSSDNEILSCRVGVSVEDSRRVVVRASSGEPGQVLTGAALLRATDVYGKAGLRSGMVNLVWEERSTFVARHLIISLLQSFQCHPGGLYAVLGGHGIPVQSVLRRGPFRIPALAQGCVLELRLGMLLLGRLEKT